MSWEGVDEKLFEELRAWRKQFATQRNVPPYMILSDTTLRDLARMRPTTMANFGLVYGIGEAKLKELGPKVVPLIADYCRANKLSADEMTPGLSKPAATASPAPAGVVLTLSRQEAARHFRQGKSIEEVAAVMGRAKSTVTQYLVEYIVSEKPASVSMWVPDEVYRQVAEAAGGYEGVAMRPLFEKLEGRVPYEEIRLVVAHLRSKHGA